MFILMHILCFLQISAQSDSVMLVSQHLKKTTFFGQVRVSTVCDHSKNVCRRSITAEIPNQVVYSDGSQKAA